MTRGLESRWAPAVVFLLTAGFVTWIWGSLREPSFIHDEAAYRLLMRAYAAQGDRTQVRSVYQRCAVALREELGMEPSQTTRSLFERLS